MKMKHKEPVKITLSGIGKEHNKQHLLQVSDYEPGDVLDFRIRIVMDEDIEPGYLWLVGSTCKGERE